jgi:class 3 adenylate cyclase
VPVLCAGCRRENPPDAAFCAGCGAGLVPVCPACRRPNAADARFCNGCGRPLGASPAGPAPGSYTPKHLAEKVLASRAALEGERKQVTVLFADVKGSMDLASRLDPEEWHRVLDRFFQILADGVHRFEGTVNQYTGDGIMALFGAPIAHEDHARRACFAALALRDELRRYAQELRRVHGLDFTVRMGLNSGEVVVGRIGDDLRMDYTAQGLTVGLAQRMEQLAEAGKPYLTDATAALVRGYFALEELGEFRVKGEAAPVRAWGLEGVGALRTRLDVSRARGFSRFVGRVDETALLESALERALAGQGQVVGVVADAGTGKSRLCFEFVERCRARGILVHEAQGVAHGKTLAYLPVLQLLRAYFEITERDGPQTARHKIAGALLLLDRDLEDALPLLFEFLGVADPDRRAPDVPPEERQRRLLGIVRRVVEARSARRPAVLLLEDLHWFDSGSNAFVEGSVESAARTRTLLLLNFRPEYRAPWMERAHYQQLPLLPLGPTAIDELLHDLLGADASLVGLGARIHERTAGNPFFIEEAVQALVEDGRLTGVRGAYRLARPIAEVAVPASVQAVLAARIDRLAEREKEVLHAAAVIGREFPEPVLRDVVALAEADLADALRALTRAEFLYEEALYPEARYAFKHPLTQEVAYGSQLGDRRARVHAAVARALEERARGREDEQAAILAHHWEEAREPLVAARWHRRAAERSGLTNVEQTFHHWGRVRALVQGLPAADERDQLAALAGLRMLWAASRLALAGDVESLFAEAAERARRSGDEAMLAQLGTVHAYARMMATGNVAVAVPELEAAYAVLEREGDTNARLLSCNNLASAYVLAGRYEACVEITERGRSLLGPSDDDTTLGAPASMLFLYVKAVGLARLGRIREAEGTMDALAARGRATDSPVASMIVAQGEVLRASVRGNPTAASLHGANLIDQAERIGLRSSLALGCCVTGQVYCDAGRWHDAVAVLERAQAMHEDGNARPFEVLTLGSLARARLGLGDLAGARAAADRAVSLARERGTAVGTVAAWVVRARVRMREERPPVAEIERDLAEADACSAPGKDRLAAPEVLLARAELAERLGDSAARERHVAAAERLARAIGMSLPVGTIGT